MSFRLVDHTADLAIEAEGASAEEVLADAGRGLTAVLTGQRDLHALGRPDRELAFAVEAPDRVALMVAFLSELLWHSESQDLLWLGGGITLGTGREGIARLEARGNAVRHDPARHGRGVEVKAVTYHDTRFEQDGGRWHLRVLLDI
ncbi:MAG TPA: archease [Candidatus Thermoplasmatota archaeon]|nr:archease [Candidatus Thermoplasmatota archaeon]